MNIRALKFFVAVVDNHSFIRAADLLCVTQPAISKSIKTLETELGCTLLTRTNKAITPTRAGQMLYRHATNILNEINALKTNLRNMEPQPSRRLTLGLPASSPAVFMQIVNHYIALHPEVSITLVDKCSGELEQLVALGKLNMAIITLPLAHPRLRVVARCPERLILVSAQSNPLPGPESGIARQIPTLSFVTLSEEHRLTQHIQRLLKRQQWHPVRHVQTNSIEQIIALVASSRAVALLPESLSRLWVDKPITLHPLNGDDYRFYSGVVVKPGRILSLDEQQLLELIVSTLDNEPGIQDFSS